VRDEPSGGVGVAPAFGDRQETLASDIPRIDVEAVCNKVLQEPLFPTRRGLDKLRQPEWRLRRRGPL
jgi:hypothetical protein